MGVNSCHWSVDVRNICLFVCLFLTLTLQRAQLIRQEVGLRVQVEVLAVFNPKLVKAEFLPSRERLPVPPLAIDTKHPSMSHKAHTIYSYSTWSASQSSVEDAGLRNGEDPCLGKDVCL